VNAYDKSRVIGCAEESSDHLALPRGCITQVIKFLNEYQIQSEVIDKTFIGNPIDITFTGKLRKDQQLATKKLTQHNIGVLTATTAFGKTVIGTWMITHRKVNTLILVHRQQLLN